MRSLLSNSLTGILSALLIIPIYPLLAVVSTLLYYDLRIRKEGFDLEVMSRELGAPAGTAAGGLTRHFRDGARLPSRAVGDAARHHERHEIGALARERLHLQRGNQQQVPRERVRLRHVHGDVARDAEGVERFARHEADHLHAASGNERHGDRDVEAALLAHERVEQIARG